LLDDSANPLISIAADSAVGSVGIVVKKFWSFGSAADPFVLENGQTLPHVDIAYEIYGTPNIARDNVILVQHGLTGSSHAAGKYAPHNRSVGYWDGLIGPGKVFDTNRFCVVATNSLGGCRGTTGPASLNPLTGKPYGISFPLVTIRDMVLVQERLLREHLGITHLALVTGGSMGGMQALEWAAMFPDRVRNLLPIATGAHYTARAIAYNALARRAITLDPAWRQGDYYDAADGGPQQGLALARMVATMTYLTHEVMEDRFGRTPATPETELERDLHARFDVERYLHAEGEALVRRFDANSYLYMTKAADLHDLSRGYPSLEAALSRITARTLLVAIRSDEIFPPYQAEEIAAVLERHGRDVTSYVLESAYGHDAFLVEQDSMLPVLRRFVASITLQED
jgi:homoserine O-acetyltransferase/O-succinyltransferase